MGAVSTQPDTLSTADVRVMMVCTGNICRSPMAEAVLRSAVASSDLAGRVRVDSSGTHGYHVGDEADPRARTTLVEAGYPVAHSARRFDPGWLAERDLILAMDAGHLQELRAIATRAGAGHEHIRLFRDFDPDGPGDVPDPYYDTVAEFREVLAMLERSMPGLLAHLRALLELA